MCEIVCAASCSCACPDTFVWARWRPKCTPQPQRNAAAHCPFIIAFANANIFGCSVQQFNYFAYYGKCASVVCMHVYTYIYIYCICTHIVCACLNMHTMPGHTEDTEQPDTQTHRTHRTHHTACDYVVRGVRTASHQNDKYSSPQIHIIRHIRCSRTCSLRVCLDAHTRAGRACAPLVCVHAVHKCTLPERAHFWSGYIKYFEICRFCAYTYIYAYAQYVWMRCRTAHMHI